MERRISFWAVLLALVLVVLLGFAIYKENSTLLTVSFVGLCCYLGTVLGRMTSQGEVSKKISTRLLLSFLIIILIDIICLVAISDKRIAALVVILLTFISGLLALLIVKKAVSNKNR